MKRDREVSFPRIERAMGPFTPGDLVLKFIYSIKALEQTLLRLKEALLPYRDNEPIRRLIYRRDQAHKPSCKKAFSQSNTFLSTGFVGCPPTELSNIKLSHTKTLHNYSK